MEAWPLYMSIMVKKNSLGAFQWTKGDITSIFVHCSKGHVPSITVSEGGMVLCLSVSVKGAGPLSVRPIVGGMALCLSVLVMEVWPLFLSLPVERVWLCTFQSQLRRCRLSLSVIMKEVWLSTCQSL